MKQIGDKDVVYDEEGNFVCTRPGSDPRRKGVIYIRKKIKKNYIEYPPGKSYKGQDPREYEDLPFKSAEAKTNLKAEAYSKIFTHILSMDDGIEKDLKELRNGKVSVVLEIGDVRSYYNMTEEEKYKGRNEPNAFADARKNIVVAKIGAGVANADDNYATIWNILSLLGVHEMKHVTLPWTRNIHRTHHLNYMFQKGHHTWKNTTQSFKENIDNTLKTRYYNDYKADIKRDSFRETLKRYRKFGIFPHEGEEFEDIENRIINIIKDNNQLNAMDDYFERTDKHNEFGDFYQYRKKDEIFLAYYISDR